MVLNVGEITQIGRYPVDRLIAEGGMSWVFKVRDPQLYDQPRALKLLKPGAAEGDELKRFTGEAKLLARIQHPNLIFVYEVGKDAETGCHFYTMEFVEGQTLADLAPDWLEEPERGSGTQRTGGLPSTTAGAAADTVVLGDPDATAVGPAVTGLIDKRHSVRDVCEYFSGVLSALARLHRERIIHRDIKPQNIFLTRDGIAKLGDLGIAKTKESAGVTQIGRTPGTPLYMSPEHSVGDPVSVRSDLFSLGLSMYRVLTGRTIYDHVDGVDSTNSQAVLKHLWQLQGGGQEFHFPFPKQVPPSLRKVISTACRMKESERFDSANEMNEALRDVISEIDHGRRGRGRAFAGGGLRVPTWLVAAGVALPFVLAGGYYGWQKFLNSPGRQVHEQGQQLAALGKQNEVLVDYLAGLEFGPSSILLASLRDDMADASADAAEGLRLLEQGNDDSAKWLFDRAGQAYADSLH